MEAYIFDWLNMLLRWLHVVLTQRVHWNPAIAAGAKTLEAAA